MLCYGMFLQQVKTSQYQGQIFSKFNLLEFFSFMIYTDNETFINIFFFMGRCGILVTNPMKYMD